MHNNLNFTNGVIQSAFVLLSNYRNSSSNISQYEPNGACNCVINYTHTYP